MKPFVIMQNDYPRAVHLGTEATAIAEMKEKSKEYERNNPHVNGTGIIHWWVHEVGITVAPDPERFSQYEISAVIVGESGDVERLSDSGTRIEDLDDPERSCVTWSLYGFSEKGLTECIGDFKSLKGAVETYRRITGIDVEAALLQSSKTSFFLPVFPHEELPSVAG